MGRSRPPPSTRCETSNGSMTPTGCSIQADSWVASDDLYGADGFTHPGFSSPDGPREEDMYKCVHCGFCLQACPTYLETGLETESPRGRIALMKAVNEGRIGITPDVYRHWDLCIQCRACEVACPSGVPYGKSHRSDDERGSSRDGRRDFLPA